MTNTRGAFRSFLSVIIATQMIFMPMAAHAADGSPNNSANIESYTASVPHPFIFQAEDYLSADGRYTDDEKQTIETYFNLPARGALDMLILERALADKIADLEKEKTKQEIAAQIRKRDQDEEIKILIPGLGKAEITSLGIEKNSPIVTKFLLFRNREVVVAAREVDFRDITDEEKSKMTETEYMAKFRRIEANKISLRLFTNKVGMKSKVPNTNFDEIDPFPDLSQAEPETFAQIYEDFVKNAKNAPVPKNYDGQSNDFSEGAHVTVLFYDDQSIVDTQTVESFAVKTPMQKVKQYWASVGQGPRLNWEYWDNEKSVWKKLNTFRTGDGYIALFSAKWQSGIFVASQIFPNIPSIFHELIHGSFLGAGSIAVHSVNPVALAIVAGWAFTIGITSTYRNWVMLSPENRQIFLFKSFINSTIFNYVFDVTLHGANAVFSVSKNAFAHNETDLSNGIITNFGKEKWGSVPRQDERAGKNLYQLNYGNINTNVDKSFLDQQKWYLASNVLKISDLIFKGALFHALGMDFTTSRIALLLSIPFVHYLALRHAEKNDYKDKKKLREDWDDAMYIQRLTAYRQKWIGLHDGETKLSGDDKYIHLKGYRVPWPVPYIGAVPGLINDAWVIFKLTGKGLIYIPAYTFKGFVAATNFVVTRMFSYEAEGVEKNRIAQGFDVTTQAAKVLAKRAWSGPSKEGLICSELFQ